jgi:hypothetical protein
VLHLLAQGLVVLPGPPGWIAQLSFPAPDPPRQRAVGHVQSGLAGQKFLHAHPVAARAFEGILEPSQDSSIARRRCCPWLAILLPQNAAHRITRHLQQPTDLAQALALRFQ